MKMGFFFFQFEIIREDLSGVNVWNYWNLNHFNVSLEQDAKSGPLKYGTFILFAWNARLKIIPKIISPQLVTMVVTK